MKINTENNKLHRGIQIICGEKQGNCSQTKRQKNPWRTHTETEVRNTYSSIGRPKTKNDANNKRKDLIKHLKFSEIIIPKLCL